MKLKKRRTLKRLNKRTQVQKTWSESLNDWRENLAEPLVMLAWFACVGRAIVQSMAEAFIRPRSHVVSLGDVPPLWPWVLLVYGLCLLISVALIGFSELWKFLLLAAAIGAVNDLYAMPTWAQWINRLRSSQVVEEAV